MEQPNNGFIYVASVNRAFLQGAIFSATSLKDYYPEAHITLYTLEKWVTPDLYDTFDNIVTEDVPDHIRAKLWALDKTPYDLTVYLDADTEILHEDIANIWDEMTDADIMITKIRGYAGKISVFPGGELTDHCGMFMYRKTDKTMAFMKEWWELYHKQASGEWKWDTELYPEELRPWDQWTYWWLQNKTDLAIKRDFFEDDARWNFVNTYKSNENEKPIVVWHHTIRK